MIRLTLGSATLTLVNAGDIRTDLNDWFRVPEHELRPQHADLFAESLALPMQCTHIALSDASVLVDAPRWSFSPGSEFFLPDDTPPPDLVTQFGEAGVRAEDITHVVITHAHFDHFNGLLNSPHPSGGTSLWEEGLEVGFPNAWHYLGRADWESDDIQQALRDPNSMTSRTLGLLHHRNLLMRVKGDLRISDGVTILAAPGETLGHQIVRVYSEGQTLYCLGDLYHHPIEVEHPDWNVWWADDEANHASRERFVEAVLGEDVFVIASHIRGVGRLQPAATGVKWKTA